MKKIGLLMSLMLAALALTNCVKVSAEEVVTNNGIGVAVTVNADSRASMEGVKTVWEAGDQLLFGGTAEGATESASPLAYLDYTANNTFVNNGITLSSPAIFYAIFPVQAQPDTTVSVYTENSTDESEPSYRTSAYFNVGYDKAGIVQEGESAHHVPAYAPMYWKSEGYVSSDNLSVMLHHTTALLDFKVVNGEESAITVKSLQLAVPEGVNICGTYYIDLATGALIPSSESGVCNSASVQIKSAPTLAKGESIHIYLPVAPFSLNAGEQVTITVTADNGRTCVVEKSITTALAFAAGTYNTATVNFVATEEPALPEVIKILAIGNSFSADAVEQELYGLFEAVGQKVIIGDMYIGGCPLVTHAANAASDAEAYSYRKIVDGVLTKTASVKLSTALADEDWTFISVQEGAGFHGFYDTTYNGTTHSMEPDLTALVTYLQERCPAAKLVYHAPWAAKSDYTGVKFSYYGFDQAKMYEMICTATQQVLAAHPEFAVVMNSMDAIQNARTSYFGDSLNRDGWHLNYTTGRYTAGCLWFERIMGRSVVGNTYHPATISDDYALVCQTAAHEACEHPYTITDLSYFEKPADGADDDVAKRVLAKWYFSPTRTVNDGMCFTWTGQNELGIYRYSNDAGERGYMSANEEGAGRLSYVQIDKHEWDSKGDSAGLSVLNVANGGQPVMSAPMAGDYWQFATTGGNEFAEGTQLHIIYTYNPGNYGAKYWRIEYLDGEAFLPVPAFELRNTTISASGETIDYNIEFTTDQKIVDFTVTLNNPTNEFVVRQVCCSSYQVNSKWFAYPNVKCVSRIAGDPANEAKPLPQMSQIL